MKNIFLILAGGLLFSVSAEAQKKKVHKKKMVASAKLVVPQNIDSTFKTHYSTAANSKWSKNYSGSYIADFTNQSNMKQSVEYDRAGMVIKTKTFFDSSAVPQNVTTALQKNYSNAKLSEVSKVEIPGVAPYYSVKLLTADNKQRQLLISEDGTVSE
jgi:Tfp pilus tip-associated adhesin PilY1